MSVLDENLLTGGAEVKSSCPIAEGAPRGEWRSCGVRPVRMETQQKSGYPVT